MYNNPNGEDLSQQEKIIVIMIRDYKKISIAVYWRASHFQQECDGIFIGYEASARMSELVKDYPNAFDVRMNGRFREVKLRLENPKQLYADLPNILGRHLVREGLLL